MKPPRQLRDSLRARLLVGLAAMLLPLLVLAASTHYSFHLFAGSFREVIEEILEERMPVARLRLQLQNCRIALHHDVDDSNLEGRLLFGRLADEVDQAFAASRALPFKLARKRQLLEEAAEAWRQAGAAARQILELAAPAQAPAARPSLRQFDRHLDRAALLLKEVEALAEAETAHELAEAAAAERRITRLNAAVFVVGAGMALGIGLLLARTVLRPLRQLERGVRRLASGDLTHRLEGGSADELGQLSAAFNAMAEQLEQDQKALRDLSIRDPLTGLYNHREFFRLLHEELERARRYRHPLSVLMCDLDFFKTVNDTFGHPAGDQALLGVAALIRGEVRRVDHVARYGGEEFAAILPETTGPEALAMANRIRQAVAARPLPVEGADGLALTISIGVAVFPDDAEGGPQLVARADQALYHAKKAGRNRVCWPGVTPLTPGPPP